MALPQVADSVQLLPQGHARPVLVSASAVHVLKDAKHFPQKSFALTTECGAFLVELQHQYL